MLARLERQRFYWVAVLVQFLLLPALMISSSQAVLTADQEAELQFTIRLLRHRVEAMRALDDAVLQQTLTPERLETLYADLRFPALTQGGDSDAILVSYILSLISVPEARTLLRRALLDLYAGSPFEAPESTSQTEAANRTDDLLQGIRDHVGLKAPQLLETDWLTHLVRNFPESRLTPPTPWTSLLAPEAVVERVTELFRTRGPSGDFEVRIQNARRNVQTIRRGLQAIAEAHALHIALLTVRPGDLEGVAWLRALLFHMAPHCTTQALIAARRTVASTPTRD